jgi:4-amino-4-deoxy-L-arabinose transferase-like glycosyltransferase
MKRLTLILLIGIMLIGACLRLYNLGAVPISPDWDEAALGYNAYSILQTGRDEYGKLFPVVLRSFDDYKPALYTYFVIPAILAFDLTTFAVRLPSVVFGLLAILATFFLVRELFKRDDLSLIAALLLAVSPWHLQFSRVAFETSVGAAFNIFTALLFIKGLRKPWLLTLAAIVAGLNIYMYQSLKVFVPLFILLLVVVYRKQLFSLPKRYLGYAIVAGLITVLPMAIYILSNNQSLTRAQSTSILADKNTLLRMNVLRVEENKKRGDVIGLVFDNRRVEYAKSVVSGYIAHFDLNWIFIRGDLERHHAPGMGLLYLWELPFLFLGIYFLLFHALFGKHKEAKLLLLGWFLIAPVPASVTSGVPHAVRTMNFLPTFQIFVAIGLLISILLIFRAKFMTPIKWIAASCFLIVVFGNLFYYLNQYFVQQNYYTAREWQYGYAEAIPYVQSVADAYDRIVISDRAPMDQSYIFFLFHTKFPPHEYQKLSSEMREGGRVMRKIGKYEFRGIAWDNEEKSTRTLYLGTPSEIPSNIAALKTVNYPDGSPAMKVAIK